MYREGCCVLGKIVLHNSFFQMFTLHIIYILFSLTTSSIHLELQQPTKCLQSHWSILETSGSPLEMSVLTQQAARSKYAEV